MSVYYRAWNQKGFWTSIQSCKPLFCTCQSSLYAYTVSVSKIESLAAPLLFCGIFVDARSSVSFSSGLVPCQDLKGCLKDPSFSWQSKVLPLGFGEEYISASPRQKGKLSSPVTPNNVKHEAVSKI